MAGTAAPPVIPLTKMIKSHSIRSSRRHQRHKVTPPLYRMSDAHAMLGQQCGSSDMLECCLGSCVGTSAEIQEESLQLLDWPAVCSQVACFASTPMAADQILQHGLPMGKSKVTLASILCPIIFGPADYPHHIPHPSWPWLISADSQGCQMRRNAYRLRLQKACEWRHQRSI